MIRSGAAPSLISARMRTAHQRVSDIRRNRAGAQSWQEAAAVGFQATDACLGAPVVAAGQLGDERLQLLRAILGGEGAAVWGSGAGKTVNQLGRVRADRRRRR